MPRMTNLAVVPPTVRGTPTANEARAKFHLREIAITDREVRLLKELMEDNAVRTVADWMGICPSAALMVAAGLFHKCNTRTRDKIYAFFREQTAV